MSAKKTKSELKGWKPNPDITAEELKVMRVEVLDRIITARVGLLLRHPFFGNMATRLKIEAADDWLTTAAVDGRKLYFNTQFFNEMDNKEVEFVIAHEILHMVYDHLGRRDWGGSRDARLYNVAADYIVNNLLVDDRIGRLPRVVDCYQDFKYRGWGSEEVYQDLKEKQEEAGGGQSFLDALGEMLDEHLDLEGDGSSDDQGNSKNNGKGTGRPSYSADELGQIKDEIKEAMIQAASAAGAGNVPAGVARLIKDMTESKMNWRELLRQQIQSTIKSDYTFSRPSRKSQMCGVILPGMAFQDTIDLCISLDMSGSIGDAQARDFLGEIQGIMDEYPDYIIKLWTFDTSIHNEQDFSPNNGEELTEYDIQGGGGTDFMSNWIYMKDHDIQPKKFIMFTDMYAFDSFGDPDYCDTIFINHGRPGFEAPFGITAEYSES